ncbi:cellular tumor antigen p53 [Cotesia glomerata]|uniref:p53 DNA-binding domain-containing protein n=1 Tax=Cotesia glomerata TaxID=32391 RepID=A0AAV7ILB4_COTGL|nr:cellular tumor antigen p53 [Cotesia glomerata]KAH0554579.1 hypothetical protein KQX54_011528 [Cotesia glomerata]
MCTAMSYTASQESDLFDATVFDEIGSHVDLSNLPILENEEPEEMEKKYQLNPTPEMNNSGAGLAIDPLQFGPLSSAPIIEEFPGKYNFEILIPQGRGKSSVYSQLLRKIYIDMEQRQPMRFQWSPPVDNLYLRTTLVYAEDRYRGDPVLRCHNHIGTDSPANRNMPTIILKQVVRCIHPRSCYEDISGHNSVTIPLGTPQPGCNYVPLDFMFYCKNSCSTGMNRRATQLVFTLETETREIVGRRTLEVRVCSCPKRDKEKEEETFASRGKKRKMKRIPSHNINNININTNASPNINTNNINSINGLQSLPSFGSLVPQPPPGKKLALARDQCVSLNLRLPSREIAKAVLESAYNILAGRAALTGDHAFFYPYMKEIQNTNNSFGND